MYLAAKPIRSSYSQARCCIAGGGPAGLMLGYLWELQFPPRLGQHIRARPNSDRQRPQLGRLGPRWSHRGHPLELSQSGLVLQSRLSLRSSSSDEMWDSFGPVPPGSSRSSTVDQQFTDFDQLALISTETGWVCELSGNRARYAVWQAGEAEVFHKACWERLGITKAPAC